MNTMDVIRYLKDHGYRERQGEGQKLSMPASPAALIELEKFTGDFDKAIAISPYQEKTS